MGSAPDLLSLPLGRAIFKLAWPAMASLMLLNLFSLVDVYWVGSLGTEALGGMTAATFIVWCVHAVAMIVGTGANAVVARRVGEGRADVAGHAAGQALLLALAVASLAMAAALPARHRLFGALGLTPAVHAAAVSYLTPILWGMPLIVGWHAVEAVFRGAGDTRTPMWVLGSSLLLNAVLDPLLIFGAGPLPALGVAGAAWASVVAHAAAFAIGLAVLSRREVRPRWRAGWIDGRACVAILRVGLPVATSSLLFSGIYVLLTRVIAEFGSAPVAAIGIGHRIEGVPYFACVGFAAAAATLVGQALGAGRPALATRAAWRSAWLGVAVVAAAALVMFSLGGPLIGVFADDPRVVDEGRRYLRIVAALEIGMALDVVLQGAFAGAGNALPPLLIDGPLTLLRVPGALLLAFTAGWGTAGVWWAISISTALKGALMALWFARGRWRRAVV